MRLNERYAKSGQRVSGGQIIGSVGKSGNAKRQAPHLHFELFEKNGVRVNPGKVFGCTKASGK